MVSPTARRTSSKRLGINSPRTTTSCSSGCLRAKAISRRTTFEPRNAASRASCKRRPRSEEHTSELQSHSDLVCRLLLEKKKKKRGHENGKGDTQNTITMIYR